MRSDGSSLRIEVAHSYKRNTHKDYKRTHRDVICLDLPKGGFFSESAIYHSIKLQFDAEVAEKILNVIYYLHTLVLIWS